MDSSSSAQSELLVAVAGNIGYKSCGMCVLNDNVQRAVKKPYQKPKLRVYGDIRAMTQSVNSMAQKSDGIKLFMTPLKTH